MRLRGLILLAALSVVAPGLALAAGLPVRHYTTEHGLSHNLIGRVLRDSHGYLWLCSGLGLNLFDGARFVSIGPREGLPPAGWWRRPPRGSA